MAGNLSSDEHIFCIKMESNNTEISLDLSNIFIVHHSVMGTRGGEPTFGYRIGSPISSTTSHEGANFRVSAPLLSPFIKARMSNGVLNNQYGEKAR